MEFTWVSKQNFFNNNDFEDNVSQSGVLNLTVSVDRPTFINFLNQNRTFFINSQWFFQYITDHKDGFVLNGPVNVLFTIAAPGLPAGMGTALWTATLFANVLGLEGQAQGEFVAGWIALSGGLPDMLRTATNCTGDGFTAIIFDNRFDELFGRTHV